MLNFLEGLYQYSSPGFNGLEREWFATEVISNEWQIVKLQELAKRIAEAREQKVGEVYEILVKAQGADGDRLIATLGEFILDLQQIQVEGAQRQRTQNQRIASMFLCSRLKPEWMLANAQDLFDEYGVNIPEHRDHLMGIPRARWMSDPIRKNIIDQICAMLSSSEIRIIVDAVELEMNEGQRFNSVPTTAEELLGKQQKDSRLPETLLNQNEQLTNAPIAELHPTG